MQFTVFSHIIIILIVSIISGCNSRQPLERIPERYVNVVEMTNEVAHASRLPKHTQLLSALKRRNLVISTDGLVLPLTDTTCKANLYYRIPEKANWPAFIGSHQDLLSGFYLELALNNETWMQVLEDKPVYSFGTELGLLAKQISPLLNTRDKLVIKLSSGLSANEPQTVALFQRLTQLFPNTDISLIAEPTLLSLADQFSFSLIPSFANNLAIQNKEAKTKTSVSLENQNKWFETINNRKQLSIVVDKNLTSSCIQLASFVPKPEKVYQTSNKPEDLILSLPENANFTALEKQVSLMKQGKYENLNGVELAYENYLNILSQDRCTTIDKNHKDFAYCVNREKDARDLISDAPYILRKQK